MVVLPDHIHAVWTLPPGDTGFSLRWRLIKVPFANGRAENRAAEQGSHGARRTRDRRFWEHLIRDDEDFRRHVEDCYVNPVKHHLVDRMCDWPYSSFHRDVRANLFPLDWGGDLEADGNFGERVRG